MLEAEDVETEDLGLVESKEGGNLVSKVKRLAHRAILGRISCLTTLID